MPKNQQPPPICLPPTPHYHHTPRSQPSTDEPPHAANTTKSPQNTRSNPPTTHRTAHQQVQPTRACQASPTHIPSTTRAGLSMSACTLGDAMPYAHSPQCPSHSPSTCITCRHTTTKPDTPPTLINLHLKPQRFLADPLPPPPIAAPHTTKRNNPHSPRLRTK